jgi:DNA-binding ferritin-like protein (Dps family)
MDAQRHEKLDALIALAKELHGSPAAHHAFMMQSMRDHVDEIRMLLNQNNSHWRAETVDLFIQCLLLLKNSEVDGAELESLIDKRLERFREKISDAVRDRKHKQKFKESIYGQEDTSH